MNVLIFILSRVLHLLVEAKNKERPNVLEKVKNFYKEFGYIACMLKASQADSTKASVKYYFEFNSYYDSFGLGNYTK